MGGKQGGQREESAIRSFAVGMVLLSFPKWAERLGLQTVTSISFQRPAAQGRTMARLPVALFIKGADR